MALRQTFNPALPKSPRTRGPATIKGLVEGEDFAVECPAWCDPVPDGAWPTERGWYLTVSLVTPGDDHPPEVEPVWLEWQSWAQEKNGDGWVVNEVGNDACAQRRDFHWIGKIKMPALRRPDDAAGKE